MISSALFLAAALAASPSVGNSAPHDTTLYEPELGIAFDLPRGYVTKHDVDGRGQSLAWAFDVTGKEGAVEVEVDGASLGAPATHDGLRDQDDKLLTYVRTEALTYCNAYGPEGSICADSIISLRRYHSPRGYQVFEVIVRVAMVSTWGGDDDDDSTAVADTTAPAEVRTETSFFAAGPIYAIDLGRSGSPLVVWLRPRCDFQAQGQASTVGRHIGSFIMRTIRRFKS